jgi:hypothetical protein
MSPDRRDIETIQGEHGTHCGVLPHNVSAKVDAPPTIAALFGLRHQLGGGRHVSRFDDLEFEPDDYTCRYPVIV